MTGLAKDGFALAAELAQIHSRQPAGGTQGRWFEELFESLNAQQVRQE